VAAGEWIFVLPTGPPAAALAPGDRAVGKGSRRLVEQAAGECVRFWHDPCQVSLRKGRCGILRGDSPSPGDGSR
jgi:hypothetical protein